MEQIILGGGCFWCIEAPLKALRGVSAVESGYCGGHTASPTFESVCRGDTGHAEVVRVTFDPAIISVKELLTIFFHLHDPTTVNRQGADTGSQYRSVIFCSDEGQKKAALTVKSQLEGRGAWGGGPFVTEIVPAAPFYPAEEYHQDYFARNSSQPYCVFNIMPKLAKLEKHFPEKLAAT